MPKNFRFYVNHAMTFECQLESQQCEGINRRGNQCRNRCVIGTPKCWHHLLKENKVRIKPSQFGKGLFAMDIDKGANEIVFKKNQTIVQYTGEIINRDELERRYGVHTAPYAVAKSDNEYIDSACSRGVGSLINHQQEARANCRFSYTRNGGIQVKATKNIRNGQELYLNYNKGVARGEQRYLFNEDGIEHSTR